MTTFRDAPTLDMMVTLCGARVVHVSRLEQLGVSRRTISHRCRPGGPWMAMGPAVVKLDNGPATRNDRRAASLLYAGSGAVITGLDALCLHGLRNAPAPSGPVHVLIPEDRRRAGAGLVLAERTERLPAPLPGRWPLAPVARAALDFARRSRDRNAVRTTIAEVVQRGLCSVAGLVDELEKGSRRGSALPRSVLIEIGDGVRSVAEADARTVLLRSGLPTPVRNASLVDGNGVLVAIADAWFDEVGLVWEIDSRDYHLSPADYDRTVTRRSLLMSHGAVVMQTLPTALRQRPTAVLEELDRCHTQAGLLPPPDLHLVPPA